MDGFAPASGEDSFGTPVDFSRSRDTLIVIGISR